MELTFEQYDEAGALLALSMTQDPGFTWAFPDIARRRDATSWLCRRLVRYVRQAGGTVTGITGPGCLGGTALWLEEGWLRLHPLALLRSRWAFAPFKLGREGTSRVLQLVATAEALRRVSMPWPHRWLVQRALGPESRTLEQESALLRARLDESASRSQSVWTETTSAEELPALERLGLKVVGQRKVGPVTLYGLRSN